MSDASASPPFGTRWDRVREADIAALLRLVARGEEAQVVAELAERPELGVATTACFTDPAGRRFEGSVSGWQYALWSLDVQLCWAMLLAFEAAGGETEARARAQCLCVSVGVLPWQREHGRIFDFAPLLAAYDDYDRGQGAWDNAHRIRHWCTVIGAEQRRAPAHVLQEFCRTDRPLVPPPDFTVLQSDHAALGEGGPAVDTPLPPPLPPPPPPPPSVTPSAEFDGRYERRVCPLVVMARPHPALGSMPGATFPAPPLRRPPSFSPCSATTLQEGGTTRHSTATTDSVVASERRFTRQYQLGSTRDTWRSGLAWALDSRDDGGRLGHTCAIIRGSGRVAKISASSWRAQVAIAGTADAVALRVLAAARAEQFEQLVARVRSETTLLRKGYR
jgi:hypothetical protein